MHEDDPSSEWTKNELLDEMSSELTDGELDWEAFDKNVEVLRQHEKAVRFLPDGIRSHLPDFGLFCLSLSEAAFLIAADRNDAQCIKDDSRPVASSKEREVIQNSAEAIVLTLTHDVETGVLQAAAVHKTWESAIDPDRTFVNLWQLWDWLTVRCYAPGKLIEDFRDSENNRREAVMSHAELLRLRRGTSRAAAATHLSLTTEK